ncbi:MAG: ABC transporter ATP-binding protein/permease [Legionella sp.]
MTYKLLKEYFRTSKDKYLSLFLLITIIGSVFALVFIMSLFASWSVGFWAAINAANMALYQASIGTFVALSAGYILTNIIQDYLIGLLAINLRQWLTTRLVGKYTSQQRHTYLELSRHPNELENPAQRIQHDVHIYIEQGISLSINLLQSLLTLATFLGTLWVIGGSITIFGLTIPGYLVWVAVIYSGIITTLTHFIGGSLAQFTNNQQNLEADFRSELEHLSNDAESIAQDRGEIYYQQSLVNRFKAILSNSYNILKIRIKLSALTAFYQQVTQILPYILAAPLYFTGAVNLGQLMQIGMSFGEIQLALSWISTCYESLIRFRTSAARLSSLENILDDKPITSASSKAIITEAIDSNELSVKSLNIAYPSSTNFMIKNLNLTFKSGEDTLIKGRSGLGKSTLFKIFAGTWEYGDGTVSVSRGKRMCFLPQRPSLPNDTLKAILAYPEPSTTYTDEEYQQVLKDVGDLDDLLDQLDVKKDWSKLSLGQQQRVSFARALLKKPDWLFLDEATASLDEENETKMYNLVKEQLKNTTFISIAHRSTVERFHSRTVNFTIDTDRNFIADRIVETVAL